MRRIQWAHMGILSGILHAMRSTCYERVGLILVIEGTEHRINIIHPFGEHYHTPFIFQCCELGTHIYLFVPKMYLKKAHPTTPMEMFFDTSASVSV
jgi:hypothetical protein